MVLQAAIAEQKVYSVLYLLQWVKPINESKVLPRQLKCQLKPDEEFRTSDEAVNPF